MSSRASSASRPGRSWGQLLERLAAAQYAGEILAREDAVEYAHTLLA